MHRHSLRRIGDTLAIPQSALQEWSSTSRITASILSSPAAILNLLQTYPPYRNTGESNNAIDRMNSPHLSPYVSDYRISSD